MSNTHAPNALWTCFSRLIPSPLLDPQHRGKVVVCTAVEAVLPHIFVGGESHEYPSCSDLKGINGFCYNFRALRNPSFAQSSHPPPPILFLTFNILSNCTFNEVLRFLKLSECSIQRIWESETEFFFHELYFGRLVLITDGIITCILKQDFLQDNCNR